MPYRIVLLASIVALLAGASIVATAGSARSTDASAGPTSPVVPMRAGTAEQEPCFNTPQIVFLLLWPAGFGQIDANPEGGATVTCDYTAILTHENPCPVPVPRGSSVTVAATPEPPTFVRWSRSECVGTGPCTFTPVEDEEWVAAIFTPLQLEVGIEGDGTVTAPGHVQSQASTRQDLEVVEARRD